MPSQIDSSYCNLGLYWYFLSVSSTLLDIGRGHFLCLRRDIWSLPEDFFARPLPISMCSWSRKIKWGKWVSGWGGKEGLERGGETKRRRKRNSLTGHVYIQFFYYSRFEYCSHNIRCSEHISPFFLCGFCPAAGLTPTQRRVKKFRYLWDGCDLWISVVMPCNNALAICMC